jgi:malate synthase
MDIFNEHMPGPHQYHIRREEVQVTEQDLVNPSVPGAITDKGVRENISA